jgi:hypothetical protein
MMLYSGDRKIILEALREGPGDALPPRVWGVE